IQKTKSSTVHADLGRMTTGDLPSHLSTLNASLSKPSFPVLRMEAIATNSVEVKSVIENRNQQSPAKPAGPKTRFSEASSTIVMDVTIPSSRSSRQNQPVSTVDSLISSILEQLNTSTVEETSSIRFRVSTTESGTVTVRISQIKDQIHIWLSTGEAESGQRLADQIENLKSALTQHGIDLARIEVEGNGASSFSTSDRTFTRDDSDFLRRPRVEGIQGKGTRSKTFTRSLNWGEVDSAEITGLNFVA
ncbi:MAG: flagellar hook-length control protein FliK, partial [Planctomycetes bacterium]|nr:flagellar hook-length control protein FliK [Planctomycetota bacterium]